MLHCLLVVARAWHCRADCSVCSSASHSLDLVERHAQLLVFSTNLCSRHTRAGIEETRMRAAALVCKVFLVHMTELATLSMFPQLWLGLLELLRRFLDADASEAMVRTRMSSL